MGKKICLYALRIAFASVLLLSLVPGRVLAQEVVQSLNGEWQWTPEGLPQQTLAVPGYYVWKSAANARFVFDPSIQGPLAVVEGVPESEYLRVFDIPQDFAGQRIFIHFEAVNYVAAISVNGEDLGVHQGGYLPFEIDITDAVTVPSTENQLSVRILYDDWRFLLAGEMVYWPNGFYGLYWDLGITDAVSLIARSACYLSDVAVMTSVSDGQLSVTAEVTNAGSEERTLTVGGAVDSGPVLPDQSLVLAPGDTASLLWEVPWSDARLWWPDDPYLYRLTLNVFEGGELQHAKTQRFGFREVGVSGHQFLLNGVPWRIMGDSFVLHSEKRYHKYGFIDEALWPTLLDSMRAVHINTIRFHQAPPPSWMIDACDEAGMLVIAESAIYGVAADRMDRYVNNGVIWLKNWVRRDRNHPSIVLWSVENEMKLLGQKFWDDQIRKWGDAVREADPSRPIIYDGDGDLGGHADFFSLHYKFGFPNGPYPAGSIYEALAEGIPTGVPVSHGEFEWSRGEIPEPERLRRMCIKTRAMRFLDWADIRPYRLDFAWHWNPDFFEMDYGGWRPSDSERALLKASLSQVAVFDYDYYKYSHSPAPPPCQENAAVTRTLTVFNDSRFDTPITVCWRVVLNDVIMQSGELSVTPAPGERAECDVTFFAPIVSSDAVFDLEVEAWQNGAQAFKERIPFKAIEHGVELKEIMARFSADVCAGPAPLTVQFTDASVGEIGSWLWSFGDGGSSTAQHPSHVYTAGGNYSVSLTVTGVKGSDTRTMMTYVTVQYPPPQARFSVDVAEGVAPLAVQFTDSSVGEISSWLWSFGDGGSSTTQHPSHVYTTGGSYTVSLTVTGPGGSDTQTTVNAIVVRDAAPQAAFQPQESSGVAPLTVQFTDHSTGVITAWHWDFGDGASSTEQHPSHTYTTPGSYSVTLTVTGPGGTDRCVLTDKVEVTANTAVDEAAVTAFCLYPNFPNPFISETQFRFAVAAAGEVTISIYDMKGREIRQLRQHCGQPGYFECVWDGRDDRQMEVSSGLYLLCFRADSFTAHLKMMKMK